MKFNKKIFIFSTIFVILILTPIALNFYYNYLLQPASGDEKTQIFVITPGQPVVQTAQNLKEANLIRNAFAFRMLVSQMGIGKNIQAGDFKLSPNLTSREIAQTLTHGAIDIWITLPEGLRKEEIAEIVEAKLKSAAGDKYAFDRKEFIKSAKEGYLFPDTYLIAIDSNTNDIITRLETTFSEKVDPKTLEKGKSSHLASDQVLILASLIEREAKTNEERPIIAGILVNRLEAGIALQVDATVQYAKGYNSADDTWWPQVTQDDYNLVKSPFNTYLNPDLPPAPIANPGIESIRAAASPTETEYFYYLHDIDGKIHYAKTAREHGANIQKYL